jgi:hypothetical protein
MPRRRQIRIGNKEYTFSVNSFILYFHEIEKRPFNLRESHEPRRNFMNRLLSGLFLFLSVTFVAHAQKVEGDWQGVGKDGRVELRVVLHLKKDETGALKGTLDSIDQGVTGVPISSISLKDSVLKFEVPSVGGMYEGKVEADPPAIRGTWSQAGNPDSFPLEFFPSVAPPEGKNRVLKPSDIDGHWEGVIETGSGKLRIVLHILTYEDGMTARLDGLARNGTGLPVTTITRDGGRLKFEMKQLAASYEGAINPELTKIDGSWSQDGGGAALIFSRAGAAPKGK